MKFTILSLTFFVVLLTSCENNNEKNTDKQENSLASTQVSEEVELLISKMSIVEKVGQMTQINLDIISKGDLYKLQEPHELDSVKLIRAINEYRVGSFLNCGGHTYSQKHWREIISKIQDVAMSSTQNKIPIIYGIDAIHGANYTVGATLFPQQIGQAASWNPTLVEQAMSIVASEVRSCGITWNFSPVLDLGRNPLWSRLFETYGEDVFLAKTMTKSVINGYQGNDVRKPTKLAACMKHFLGYSAPNTGKDRTPAWIPERQLREYYLPTFEKAIQEGAKTLMINSGEINGIPVHANKDILTTLLREELGFEGIAVTDWEDVIKLHREHKVASSLKEAVRMAVDAGIDMSMTPNDYQFNELLIELVKEGVISEARLNKSVRRILMVKKQLGLFENQLFPLSEYRNLGDSTSTNVALKLAQESMTLLKNQNNNLPIPKSASVFITGASANSLNVINGAWTHTWQGTDTKYNTKGKQTILDAMRNEFDNVYFEKGSTHDSVVDLENALKTAAKCDRIVICIGEKPATEKPGDIPDLALPSAQSRLVKELSKLGKPITLVLVTHRPRIIREIEPLCDGILMAYLPGDEGGVAIATSLSGKNNPSGKLPYTYPRYSNSLLNYDYKEMEKIDVNFGMSAVNPQWAFGHGLSYSEFKYESVKLNKKSFSITDTINVTISLSNLSKIDGAEVVQVYVRDEYASIAPSNKRLRGYSKAFVSAGTNEQLEIKIPIAELAFVNQENKWTVEPGEFTLIVRGHELNFSVEM